MNAMPADVVYLVTDRPTPDAKRRVLGVRVTEEDAAECVMMQARYDPIVLPMRPDDPLLRGSAQGRDATAPTFRQRETPPRYKHPDTCCTYVGQYGPYDVYFCAVAMPPTVILRCGDAPTDYKTRDWMSVAKWAAPEVK